MKKHIGLGKRGESIAAAYLVKEGYEVLEKNWRHRRAEIDLIARKDEVLVFVEVKTRSTAWLRRPEEAVTQAKQALLANAASVYMETIGHEWEIRFDIIGIIYHGATSYDLQHYEDAFFPGW